MQPKNKQPVVPSHFLISWTANAIKSGHEGMLIVSDGERIFPHYEIPEFGLWDTAIALEKNGYEVIEFHVFKELNK